jgi:hypothetical protein
MIDHIGKLLTTSAPYVHHSAERQRKEALKLYRDILKATRLYPWKSESGHDWPLILRQSARKEFEASKEEKDPEVIVRLMVTARHYLQEAINQWNDEYAKLKTRIDDSRTDQSGGARRN